MYAVVSVISLLIFLSGAGTFNVVSYNVVPLTSVECTNSLLQAIPPIRLGIMHWRDTNLDRVVLDHSIAIVSDDGNYHGNLSRFACAFMLNEKVGRSEDGLHSRDDSLLRIIQIVARLTAERNKISLSTFKKLRSDVYLYLPGLPPLVHVEEKAEEGNLIEAINQLTAKFCSTLPHYHPQLQYIIGIAIAGDHISFGKLPLSGGRGWQMLHTFNVIDLSQRQQCIQAAINVGRWCLHAINQANPLLFSIPYRLGHTDVSERRDITLMPEGIVIKRYKQLDPQEFSWLYTLYTTLASPSAAGAVGRIRYMEWAMSCVKKSRKSLGLKLMPLGVGADRRPPRDLVELRAALRCILTCLQDLHQAGWAHLDVRWSNVVFIAPNHWVVIDAEFARPFNNPIPVDLKCKDPDAVSADEATDCYLVGLMMQEYPALIAVDSRAQALCDALVDVSPRARSRRKARYALNHAFFSAP